MEKDSIKLRETIDANIVTNGRRFIDGRAINLVLNDIVDNLDKLSTMVPDIPEEPAPFHVLHTLINSDEYVSEDESYKEDHIKIYNDIKSGIIKPIVMMSDGVKFDEMADDTWGYEIQYLEFGWNRDGDDKIYLEFEHITRYHGMWWTMRTPSVMYLDSEGFHIEYHE